METESDSSTSDSEDESNTNDQNTKLNEEPTSKRHKLVREAQGCNTMNKPTSNTSSACENSIQRTFASDPLSMDEYAFLKCELRQRKLYLTVSWLPCVQNIVVKYSEFDEC